MTTRRAKTTTTTKAKAKAGAAAKVIYRPVACLVVLLCFFGVFGGCEQGCWIEAAE